MNEILFITAKLSINYEFILLKGYTQKIYLTMKNPYCLPVERDAQVNGKARR